MSKQAAAIHSPDALLEGAIAIAMHQVDGIEAHHVDRVLQSFADTIRSRVRGPQPQALLAHLHQFLFDEQGFSGNGEEYYDVTNSYVPTVMKSKRGLPIALSLIYKVVADRIGLRCWGIGLPGHFIIGVDVGESAPMLIDPFSGGQMLTLDEAQQRMQDTYGEEAEWSDELLQPVSNLHWLTRMIQNLLHVFAANRQYSDLAAMLELEMLLWPRQTHLKRDLALVLARLNLSQPAALWLNDYLRSNPDDPQKGDLEQLLEVLSA